MYGCDVNPTLFYITVRAWAFLIYQKKSNFWQLITIILRFNSQLLTFRHADSKLGVVLCAGVTLAGRHCTLSSHRDNAPSTSQRPALICLVLIKLAGAGCTGEEKWLTIHCKLGCSFMLGPHIWVPLLAEQSLIQFSAPGIRNGTQTCPPVGPRFSGCDREICPKAFLGAIHERGPQRWNPSAW